MNDLRLGPLTISAAAAQCHNKREDRFALGTLTGECRITTDYVLLKSCMSRACWNEYTLPDAHLRACPPAIRLQGYPWTGPPRSTSRSWMATGPRRVTQSLPVVDSTMTIEADAIRDHTRQRLTTIRSLLRCFRSALMPAAWARWPPSSPPTTWGRRSRWRWLTASL